MGFFNKKKKDHGKHGRDSTEKKVTEDIGVELKHHDHQDVDTAAQKTADATLSAGSAPEVDKTELGNGAVADTKDDSTTASAGATKPLDSHSPVKDQHQQGGTTMLFKTSEKYEELRKAIREFAETEVKPIAFQLDQNNEFPHDIVKMMGEHGWMGIPYAQEYGGAGSDALAYAIAVEELSRVDGGVGVILSAHTSLGSYPIEAFGTEEQKQKYLVPLASGEKLGAFGLTEPEAGSDAGGTQTTAELDGDYYILNGNKIFITNAPEADTYVVFAVTTPGIGTKGISAFIVEKGWEGFSFGDPYDKLGIRSSKTAELIFDNVKVPKENLLGQEGQGFRIAMQTLDGGRIGIAAQALGIAQGAYEAALQYSKERVQFGRPISQLQSIQFKFADMATKLRCARFLIYSAAELKSNHEPYGMEAAMAKMYASDIALEVTNDALQIHGGNGYLKGMEVERFYRDAKITTIYEGTNEIQRVVIGSYLIPRPKSNKKAKKAVAAKPEAPITGERKRQMIKADTPKEAVDELLAALKKDGYDFTVGIDVDTPIVEAERVISVGKGIGGKENMELARETAKAFGGALGSSRPVAETMKLLPLERYVGMSGQKFKGNLYVAFGISGASQHLKGIKDAATIVAVNKNANAPIFKNADYGIVGDMLEIMPLIIEALGTEGKGEAPEFKRVRRSKPRKLAPTHGVYVCTGCGYEYVPDLGDPEGEIEPGTTFEALPDSWICPECQKEKSQFVKEEFPKDRQ